MERAVTFTISKGIKGYNIKCKALSTYNCYEVAKEEIFDYMEETADICNNILGIAVTFDVE